ncbi:MAG: hypothetical protein GX230_08275 [Lentisphaerae bacterium]|nr:hypothetical protein [Lentisphaerota bacterium]
MSSSTGKTSIARFVITTRAVVCSALIASGVTVVAEEPSPQKVKPLPEPVKKFLQQVPEYDKEWPPAFTEWVFEAVGGLSSDSWKFGSAVVSDSLKINAMPKGYRAYFHGAAAVDSGEQWLGQGVVWRLRDSRQLVADVIFRSAVAGRDFKSAPRACVAVYTVADNKLIASAEVPLILAETKLRIMKHFSYNRLTLLCETAKIKRGFTIPDHLPLRLVLGVTACGSITPGDIAVTMAVEEGDHL